MNELQWSHILLGITYLGWFLMSIFVIGVLVLLALHLAGWIHDKLEHRAKS